MKDHLRNISGPNTRKENTNDIKLPSTSNKDHLYKEIHT